MSETPVTSEDQFIWHVTVDRYGTVRDFTFFCGAGFDQALTAAKLFLSKRYPNRLKDDERFSGDDEGDRHFRECLHDPELSIVGLKRGHELSSTEESEW